MARRACAAAALLFAAPAAAQPQPDASWDAATIYAIIDKNEWCQGGSVHIDLWTGRYTLLPRPTRAACQPEPRTRQTIENGSLADPELAALRDSYRRAVIAGLERQECEAMLTNGGREVLAIVGPRRSFVTPKAEGCWSPEARDLHDRLFTIFGAEREPVPAADLLGRREVPATGEQSSGSSNPR